MSGIFECTCPNGHTPTNRALFLTEHNLHNKWDPAETENTYRSCGVCAEASYKPIDGPDECMACPPHTTSMKGSSYRKEFLSVAGYTLIPTIKPVQCGGDCGGEGVLAPGDVISAGEVGTLNADC